MAAWVRIGTALYLALALPGLVFGFLTQIPPLGLPCEPTEGSLLGPAYRTSGEYCHAIDPAFAAIFVSAAALLVIGWGVARARAES